MAILVGPDPCHHLGQEAVYFLVDPLNPVLGDHLMPLSLPVALLVALHVDQLVFQDLLVVLLVLDQCIQELQEVGVPEVDLVTLPLVLVDPLQVVHALVDPLDGLVKGLVHLVPNSHPTLHGDQGDLQVNLVHNFDQR